MHWVGIFLYSVNGFAAFQVADLISATILKSGVVGKINIQKYNNYHVLENLEMDKFSAPPNRRYVELPSLEEIAEMDKQREYATDSLEISDDSTQVKCQNCGLTVPIVGGLTRPHSYQRVVALKKRIRWIEEHSHNSSTADNSIKTLKQELAALLKKERKRDILRRLPLHSSRMTGYRWVCSKCWDEIERSKQRIKADKYPLLF